MFQVSTSGSCQKLAFLDALVSIASLEVTTIPSSDFPIREAKIQVENSIMVATRTIWSHAALASLLASAAPFVAGQPTVVLIPRSFAPLPPPAQSHDYDGSLGAEPPCRQRRLAPWRQQIRERCRADVARRCLGEERDLLRRGAPSPSGASLWFRASPSPASPLFGDVLFGREGARSVADPFDDLFNRVLGASLRAFDQMVLEEEPPSVGPGAVAETPGEEETQEEQQEAQEGGGEEDAEASSQEEDAEYVDVSPPSSEDASLEDALAGDVSSEDAAYRRYVKAAPTPEQAAEHALDFLVASLAAHVNAAESASADVKIAEDEAASQGEEVPGVLPSTADLPGLLSQRGHALLAEAAGRRRLTEGAAPAEEPRAKVEARLARRLTEYRTDLFYVPAEGTVTLYTLSMPEAGQLQDPLPPALGLGSHRLDGCVRAAFRERDLSVGCHRAVGDFLVAVEQGRSASSYHGQPGPASAEDASRGTMLLIALGTFVAIALAGLLCIALMNTVEYLFCIDDDEESWAEEEAGEFDYAALPDGDTNQVTGGEEDLEEPRVFVGIPLQIV